MFTNTTAQIDWGTAPLAGRGTAPVIATVQGDRPDQVPVSLITADLRFNIPAIKADAKARYAAALPFVDSYTGSARRWWQWRKARQAVRQAWREARTELHNAAFARLPRQLPFTAEELDRMDALRATTARASISMAGNQAFRSASGEFAQINFTARQRALRAVIKQARGEV